MGDLNTAWSSHEPARLLWQAVSMTTTSGVHESGAVVTIGVFDGVHRGHRALLAQARAEADALGLPLVVVTFDPHPVEVVRPGSHPPILATLPHRIRLLREAGADDVDVLTFDTNLSTFTPEDFVERVLVGDLDARLVVVGANFRFGQGAAGDVNTLAELGKSRGYSVSMATLVESGTGVVSSTAIRTLVMEGRVEEAADALLRPHRVEGIVVHGDHRGRELGYPTANLGSTGWAAIPADGVYAARLIVDPEGAPLSWPAAVSVGTNPTFEAVPRRVEAYAIDAGIDLDLYDKPVAVDFVKRLRDMVAFDDLDSLVSQMAADVSDARGAVGEPSTW